MAVADPFGEAFDLLGYILPCKVEKPSVEVFDLAVAGGFGVTRVLGRVVGHHDVRVRVEGIDWDACAVVHRRVRRTPHPASPELPPPVLDASEQRLCSSLVFGLEETEEDQVVAVGFIVVVIIDSCYAPDDLAVALGEEELD